jgi:hypothetical protein
MGPFKPPGRPPAVVGSSLRQPEAVSDRGETPAAAAGLPQGKLFIGGVEATLITKEELVEYCSQW